MTTEPHPSLRSSQVGAIHPLYLHSAMSDMSLPIPMSWRRDPRPGTIGPRASGLAPPHLTKARPTAMAAE
jgi:hypothetical protein